MSATHTDEHWEHGGLATGLAVGLGAVWAWAIATPSTLARIPADPQGAAPAPDLGLVLVPLLLLLGGMVAGATLWSLVVEHRVPRPVLRHGRGRSRRWPALAASISALVVGRIAAESGNLAPWSARINRDATEFAVRATPLAAAVALTAIALTWAVVYVAGRFVMGDDDEDVPETVSAPA